MKKKIIIFIMLIVPIFTFGQSESDTTFEKDEIFLIVEDMPQFPGGEVELRKFIAENLKFPEIDNDDEFINTFQGKIYVRFIINEKGEVVNPEIVRGENTLLNNEVLRVINLMPNWIPGKQNG